MIRYALALTWAVSTVALASTYNISKVNGSIEIDTGQEAGDVSTVNGGIRIGEGARVHDIETVNGSIRLEDRAVAKSADTVNGSITVGEQVQVDGEVATVNGGVELGKGARVGGSLETVNGRMDLTEATVAGGLETVNGDITVGANSRVDGGILVEKPNKSSWSAGKQRNPRVTIEAGAVVNGTLRFEREVDLYLSPSATIGSIEGVPPVRHTLQ
jgi:DUF4097 and DUF4098 domain-containing protein YvlB